MYFSYNTGIYCSYSFPLCNQYFLPVFLLKVNAYLKETDKVFVELGISFHWTFNVLGICILVGFL